MPQLFNLARMTSSTTSTGTITLGTAVSGYLTFAAAGVADGNIVFYGIKDGSASECGYGTYTASGTTLSRNVIKSTNSNAAISLDGSEEVYITAVASDGGDLLHGTSNPMLGFDMPINLQLNASVASNILTIAVKGNNGSDPSNSNPVLIPFRDSTIASGDPVWVAISAALSITTNATGATLGSANTAPFRLWVVAFNNAGTVVLALWQSVTGGASPTAIAPLNEAGVASTTGISATATAAGTFYTPNGTALTSKAFRIIGYVDYASGLTTAGTYASAPTSIQLFGPGIRKPGEPVQAIYVATTTDTAFNGATKAATGLATSITPTSSPNLVEIAAFGSMATTTQAAASSMITQLYRGTGTTAIGNTVSATNTNGSPLTAPTANMALDGPGSSSAVQYGLYVLGNSNASHFNPANINGSPNPSTATMTVKEIMA